MSEKRTLLSRPRTRVYDCNYNIGEKYYKPMVDQLDRKYSGTSSLPSFTTPPFTSRIRDDDDFPSISTRRPSPFSSATSDFESSLSERRSRLNGETRSLEDDLEDEIVSSMKKLKVLRAAKAASVEEELNPPTSILNGFPKHKRLNLTEKILDSVGVNGKLQDSLEEEILKKRTIKVPSLFDDDKFTKWTAMREPSINDTVESSAAARARQSRARLADIESEIDAVTQKGLAREKRLNNLKALIAGEDPFLDTSDSFKSTKKVSKTTKKVSF
ncbi:uncharacterized protein LOC135844960 [Planococcus citri]|uniref:uncharacterized protein LOC135844960 n=1 Tax=Planococcus citri TaxID=170843 RepID=UPI0031F7829E